MDERLAWMDGNYLSAFDAIDPGSEVTPQPASAKRTPPRRGQVFRGA